MVGHNAVALLMRRAGLTGATGRPKWRHAKPDQIAADLLDPAGTAAGSWRPRSRTRPSCSGCRCGGSGRRPRGALSPRGCGVLGCRCCRGWHRQGCGPIVRPCWRHDGWVPEVDDDQLGALRRLRAAFGFVEIIEVISHDEGDDLAAPSVEPIEGAGMADPGRMTPEEREHAHALLARAVSDPDWQTASQALDDLI
jgi:hypothetical protein